MSEMIQLKSSIDNFEFGALHAEAQGRRVGGVVIVGDVYGLNKYIKLDIDRWASRGFEVIAPAMFDRFERGYSVAPSAEALDKGLRYMNENGDKNPISDVQAAIDALSVKGLVFFVGYCYGGTIAYRAASVCSGLSAASSYYGGGIHSIANLPLKTPIICHFGLKDPYINVADTKAKILAAHPEVPIYEYPNSSHGFAHIDDGAEADKAEAALARQRTLEFFQQHGAR